MKPPLVEAPAPVKKKAPAEPPAKKKRPRSMPRPGTELTDAEFDTLELMAKYKGNKEKVAKVRTTSMRSVDAMLWSAYRRLKVGTLIEALFKAGIIEVVK